MTSRLRGALAFGWLALGLAACVPEIAADGCLSDSECPEGTVCNVLGVCALPSEPGAAWLDEALVQIASAESVAADRVVAQVVAEAPDDAPQGTTMELCARDDEGSSESEICARRPFRQGTSELTVAGLRGGTEYRFVPALSVGGLRHEGQAVAALTRPEAVTRVEASDGESPEYVSVSWEPVPGAERYRVFRDGREVAATTATSFVDLGATPGGTPGRVGRLAATQGTRPDAVEVSWQPAPVVQGATHWYSVLASNAAGDSVEDAADAGYRSGPPVLEYVLLPSGRNPIVLGGALGFVDTDAPEGTLRFGALEVSQGTMVGAIAAHLPLVDRSEGVPVTYTVVARNAVGFGPAGVVSGFRATPGFGIAWEIEVSGNEDGAWESLPGEDREVTVTLPAGAVRRLRAVVASDSGVATYSGRGWAGACGDEVACPEGTSCMHGFCVAEGYVFVPAHAHRLGSTQPTEYGRESSEAAFVAVFEHSRLFGETEVTQAQWREVMGSTPSYFSQCGETCPVENVSWGSALAYCNALSVRDGLAPCYDLSACAGDAATGELVCERDPGVLAPDGDVYACEGWRLPTGYEWEWAARGLMDAWDESWLPTPEAPDCRASLSVDHQAFAQTCASPPQGYPGTVCGSDRICRGTVPVASLLPSPWGLFDVAGNVWEWTWGRQAPVPPADSVVVEPLPIGSTAGNVSRRGAAWNWRPYHARLGKLSWVEPGYRANDTGFRVVRTVR